VPLDPVSAVSAVSANKAGSGTGFFRAGAVSSEGDYVEQHKKNTKRHTGFLERVQRVQCSECSECKWIQ
jgi:hypothetical protein